MLLTKNSVFRGDGTLRADNTINSVSYVVVGTSGTREVIPGVTVLAKSKQALCTRKGVVTTVMILWTFLTNLGF